MSDVKLYLAIGTVAVLFLILMGVVLYSAYTIYLLKRNPFRSKLHILYTCSTALALAIPAPSYQFEGGESYKFLVKSPSTWELLIGLLLMAVLIHLCQEKLLQFKELNDRVKNPNSDQTQEASES